MCDQVTIDRIDSGKYIAVPKWQHRVKLWVPIFGPVIAVVIFLIATIRWYDDANERMFDSQKQKYETLQELHYDTANILKPKEKAEILQHIHNPDLHMSKKIKDQIYVPRNELVEMNNNLKNQIVSIKADVQWIKRYLINNK